MNIRIVSDLHLEFVQHKWRESLKNICDSAEPGEILVVCGDTCSHLPILRDAMVHFSRHFAHAIYVLGNHEFYGNERERVFEFLRADKLNNVHLLENEKIEIDGQCFLGTTLWFANHPMNQFHENRMNDFWTIPKFNTWNYKVAEDAKAWLGENVLPGDIVISHHLPSPALVSPEYKISALNRFFVHDCEDIMAANLPAYWFFGHTHTSFDHMIGDTRCIANPRGYARNHDPYRFDNLDFDYMKRITI